MLSQLKQVLTAALFVLPIAAAAQVNPPQYAQGDTWTYRELNGYNNVQRAVIVRSISGTAGDETRVTTSLPDGRVVREDRYAGGALRDGTLNDRAAGALTPPLDLRPYPLNEGQRWSQRVTRSDRTWHENRPVRLDGKVVGWENVRVPAGEFKAIKIERQMWLGDGDPFRNETLRSEVEWYVPELKAPVKLYVREFYRQPANRVLGHMESGDWYVQELTGFKTGN